MNFKEITAELNGFSNEHKLVEQARARCLECLNAHYGEWPEEFKGNQIADFFLIWRSQSLVIKNMLQDSMVLVIRIGIYTKDSKGQVDIAFPFGYYDLESDENGQFIDDWLIFE